MSKGPPPATHPQIKFIWVICTELGISGIDPNTMNIAEAREFIKEHKDRFDQSRSRRFEEGNGGW